MQTCTFWIADLPMDFIFVEGGDFQLGGKSWLPNTLPDLQIQIPSFWIGKFPVTQALWQVVMGQNPSFFKGNLQCPVEQVTWDNTQAFLAKLNQDTNLFAEIKIQTGLEGCFDLPTEAQWEYVAKGGKFLENNKFAGSNDAQEVAWYDKNTHQTQTVGLKKSNMLGVHDLSGNVWEWCKDYFVSDFYAQCLAKGNFINPYQYVPNAYHVIRGGSWSNSEAYLPIQNRTGSLAESCENNIGFRLALF